MIRKIVSASAAILLGLGAAILIGVVPVDLFDDVLRVLFLDVAWGARCYSWTVGGHVCGARAVHAHPCALE